MLYLFPYEWQYQRKKPQFRKIYNSTCANIGMKVEKHSESEIRLACRYYRSIQVVERNTNIWVPTILWTVHYIINRIIQYLYDMNVILLLLWYWVWVQPLTPTKILYKLERIWYILHKIFNHNIFHVHSIKYSDSNHNCKIHEGCRFCLKKPHTTRNLTSCTTISSVCNYVHHTWTYRKCLSGQQKSTVLNEYSIYLLNFSETIRYTWLLTSSHWIFYLFATNVIHYPYNITNTNMRMVYT